MKRSRKSFRAFFGLFALLCALMIQWDAAAAKIEPKSGFISEVVAQLDRVKGQIVSLEGAMPQEKFGWRPSEGVRSVSELYLHIGDGLYLFANAGGMKSPVDDKSLFDEKTRDSRTTDKAAIGEWLNTSFGWTSGAIAKLTDSDLEKQVVFFGSKMTLRNLLVTLLNHTHEHLGQAIAYARSNGVVPPWTAKAEAAMKAKAEKK